MKSLNEVVASAEGKQAVVADVVALIDGEVAKAKGLSGMGLQAGYKLVKKLKDGRMIGLVVNGLLPEFVAAIEPLHLPYREAASTQGFDKWLVGRKAEAINGLLSVTDRRAQITTNALLKKTYGKLRPVAEGYVESALPGLGVLVDRHCA